MRRPYNKKRGYRDRGDVADDILERFEAIEGNALVLSPLQRRQLRLQIREAIVRWEETAQRRREPGESPMFIPKR